MLSDMYICINVLRNPQYRPPFNLIALQFYSNFIYLRELKNLILGAHFALRRHLQQCLHLVFRSYRAAHNVVSAIDTVKRRDRDVVIWARQTNANEGPGGAQELNALFVGLFEANNHDDGMGADFIG